MFPPIAPAPALSSAAQQHQYETRTRSNSGIRPSIRLRQSPDAPQQSRRVKPIPASKTKLSAAAAPVAQTTLPPFPPPHVMLHADDAGNKVFLAIGRALVSVDNRAMTVKDLSELSMKYGLMCQNMSAAGQAITTFIRNHLQRCEIQQDQPLLLRHVMSGTIADDDLVPALYSRVGGAHCTHAESEGRLTNFRRGTMVWYLSKAAGAPCPFSRSGIRLCDYNENGKIGMPINPGREKKRERDRLRKAAQTAGQKRKRLLRSCADNGSESESESESSSDEEKRPPKVKLTLRLKPSLTPTPGASDSASSESRASSLQPDDLGHDDDSDESDSSMSVDSDSEESPYHTSAPLPRPQASPPAPAAGPSCSPSPLSSNFYPVSTRSPSLPCTIPSGSPPPDSEDEDEDFHITMTGARRSSVGRLRTPFDDDDSAWEDDFFGDFDGDAETQWESPGPRSPSVQLEDDIVVKQEPTDVSGLLDAWEDLENRAKDMKVIDVVAQAAAAERQAEQSTSGDLDAWCWPGLHPEPLIKQEEIEAGLFFTEDGTIPPVGLPSSMVSLDVCGSPVEERPLYPCMPDPYYTLQWRDVEILGPDSVKLHDLDAGAWREYRGARAISPEERVQSSSPAPSSVPAASPQTSPTLPRGTLALEVPSPATSLVQDRQPSITSPTLIASLTSLSIQVPTASAIPSLSLTTAPQVATPCPSEAQTILPLRPLFPPICVVDLEGVAVYQATLGDSTILRRVDTGFVNLSPVCEHLRIPLPSTPNTVAITAGSPFVRGTWAPLDVARDIAKDVASLEVFFSENLRLLFPDGVDALCPSGSQATRHATFGQQFKSASDARRLSMSSHRLELPPREFEEPWDEHLTTHPSFTFPTSAVDDQRPTSEEIPAVEEPPLSPTEAAIFRVLCSAPEWETTTSSAEEPSHDADDGSAASAQRPTDPADGAQEQSLRRSKRVVNVAARSRTRSTRRGSRTSLS